MSTGNVWSEGNKCANVLTFLVHQSLNKENKRVLYVILQLYMVIFFNLGNKHFSDVQAYTGLNHDFERKSTLGPIESIMWMNQITWVSDFFYLSQQKLRIAFKTWCEEFILQ